MASLKEEKNLILIFGLALALRLLMVKWTYVMANDGITYITMARDFFSSDFAAFAKENSHPLYPIFIGIIQKLIPDWELAGKMVSAISGSLLIIPFYIWGKRNFGEKATLYAALFLILNPYHVRYSADVITESTYMFFFFLAVIFSVDAVSKKGLILFFYSGLFIGLAYLTRPEGLLLVLPLVAWTLFSKFPSLRLKTAALLILLLTLFVVASPYLLYLHTNYGRWLLTGKYDVRRITGIENVPSITTHAVIHKGNGVKNIQNPQKKAFKKLYAATRNNLGHLAYLGKRFAVTFHPLMTLLLLYGIFREKIQWTGQKTNLYLLSIIVIYLVVLFRLHMVYDWFGRRHTLPIAILAMYWAGVGFLHFVEWLKGFADVEKADLGSHGKKVKVTALCLITVILIMSPKTLNPRRRDKLPEKRVGLWLKEISDKPPVIISNMGRISFYAGGINMFPPQGSYDHLIRYCLKNRVDYIVFNEKLKEIYPDFPDKEQNSKLNLVHSEGGGKEEKVSVYRVR